jgi:hypothetical protein
VEDAMTDRASFDELVGMFCGSLDTERGAAWHAGDIVTRALEEIATTDRAGDRPNARAVRSAERRLIGAMAEAAHCTMARVRQLGQVSATFGSEQRYPDKPWSLFRAVRAAAGRNQRDARTLLDEAVANGWGVPDLNAMGRAVPVALALRGDCAVCGSQVRVLIQGTAAARADVQALVLRCPTCVAAAWEAGSDGRDVPIVGALE